MHFKDVTTEVVCPPACAASRLGFPHAFACEQAHSHYAGLGRTAVRARHRILEAGAAFAADAGIAQGIEPDIGPGIDPEIDAKAGAREAKPCAEAGAASGADAGAARWHHSRKRHARSLS